MKPHFILLFIAVYCAAPASKCMAQRPTQVQIVLNQPWTYTGVLLDAGQHLTITASGIMNWYTGQCDGKCISTPDGVTCNYPGFTTQGLACWSLIGKIGEDGIPFQVGTCFSGIAQSSGGCRHLLAQRTNYALGLCLHGG